MHGYFLRTEKGRLRSSQVIPEPLFVRSELVSGVQLADLIAYIVSWGFRMGTMELAQRAGRSVTVSTVYVTLMRLEEKGLVESWLGEPTGVRGGKAKRHFRLAPEGAAALRGERETMERMWEGMEERLVRIETGDARAG